MMILLIQLKQALGAKHPGGELTKGWNVHKSEQGCDY